MGVLIMRTSAHGRLGFTLVELILVLTLLSILSIIAVPRIMRFNDRWILQSSAHMLANDIRLMQRLAVQECSEYNFELHTTQFYYILRINDLKKPNMKKVYLDSKITSISSTLYKAY